MNAEKINIIEQIKYVAVDAIRIQISAGIYLYHYLNLKEDQKYWVEYDKDKNRDLTTDEFWIMNDTDIHPVSDQQILELLDLYFLTNFLRNDACQTQTQIS